MLVPGSQLRIDLLGPDFEPDVITEGLGIRPTQSWVTGDPRAPRAIVKHEQCGWAIKVYLESSELLNDRLCSLLEPIYSVRHAVVQLCRDYSISVEVAVTIIVVETDPVPGMVLSNKNLRMMSELGAELEIDIMKVAPE